MFPHYTYECFYKDKRCTVQAQSSLEAQKLAEAILRPRKRFDVTVVLVADQTGKPVPINTASL